MYKEHTHPHPQGTMTGPLGPTLFLKGQRFLFSNGLYVGDRYQSMYLVPQKEVRDSPRPHEIQWVVALLAL